LRFSWRLLSRRNIPAILIPSFIGELSLCLWLLVMGVNVPKWEEKAKTLANNGSLNGELAQV